MIKIGVIGQFYTKKPISQGQTSPLHMRILDNVFFIDIIALMILIHADFMMNYHAFIT